ncbi:MAG: nuclear transport factor 2 family protein [Anaerolineae bacterium]|nr:nuclear transport factor 2 family protein [Anaerolineae bacterium]
MNNQEIKKTVREFLAAFAARDLETALSFLAEDATWITPAGEYEGKGAVRRYLKWEFETVPSLTVTETGAGLVAEGNQALIEHTLAGTVRGEPCEWLTMCAYEFRNGQIREIRTVFDRLTLVQQSATGWLESKIVDAVASQTESGVE